MPLRTYDPKDIIVTIGGVPMSGFADGTFVNVERDNDMFTKVSGADGEISRAKSNDKGGVLTLTLSQTSMSNDVLSGIAVADELTNSGVVPIFVKDINSLSTFVSAFGWVKKQPAAEYGKVINNREWVVDLADLEVFIGGVLACE